MIPHIDFHDIQGGILHGYRLDCAAHLFLNVASTDSARRLLTAVLPSVTQATQRPSDRAVNVGLTHEGLRQLGVREELRAAFPAAFKEGPAARAPRLGDIGASAPDGWEFGGKDNTPTHLVISVHALTDCFGEARDHVRELVAATAGSRVISMPETHQLKNMVEHFGYADGLAQPTVEGVPAFADSVRGGGTALRGARWRPVKMGEFVLGYADEDGTIAESPSADLIRNGTYAVYRKLRQDVSAFRRSMEKAAEVTGLSVEHVAAKVMGRWRDGVPLELAPWRPDKDLVDKAVPRPPNDFRYLPHDEEGFVCPRGAHIRRVNPRDSLPVGKAVREPGRLSARHRIIRRGMPYGDPLPAEATCNDGVDRGLFFVCYNADLERQFELIQRTWCCDGDAFGLGEDQDYLLGNQQSSGKMTLPTSGGAPKFIESPPDLVVTRGCEYLLFCGLRSLRRLAAGTYSGPEP